MILEKINSPLDLQDLAPEQLAILASELRDKIISSVAETGGHLASSLGVVELTISLHRVFNSPQDKIIWDVGHQTYSHKLLTGRQERFATLRQLDGLSGFPKRKESPYDIFETGHSSTSISAALGFARARDLKGEKGEVVAVIGDGALTGGMAYEALNDAGQADVDLVVVLNDNEMSIAANVGALSSYLSRVRTEPGYYRSKEELEKLLRKLPAGDKLLNVADRVKDSLKYLLVPGMLFEELGFTYLGPVDGHNIEQLETFLKRAKRTEGPVLVHVLTVKGKGYKPAEEAPETYHGVGPFDITTGNLTKTARAVTFTEAFSQTLLAQGRRDSSIVAVTAAMPEGTGLKDFAREFPNRFFDVGIAEAHAVTMAAGMAAGGLKPVVAIYSTFLQRAFDQVLHDVALQNLKVILAIDRAGIVGEDGETHQGLYDLSFLRLVPNLMIMAPRDEGELQRMLVTALQHPGPVAVRYPRGKGIGVPLTEEPRPLKVGRGELLTEGKDLALLAAGPLVYQALEAQAALEKKGISAAVADLKFIKPLDEELILDLARRTGRLVLIEENTLIGGLGSAILELLASADLRPEVRRVAAPDKFIEQGDARLIRERYGLSVQGILRACAELLPPQRTWVPREFA